MLYSLAVATSNRVGVSIRVIYYGFLTYCVLWDIVNIGNIVDTCKFVYL